MLTDKQLALMVKAYIAAALGVDCPEGTNPRATKISKDTAAVFCHKFAGEAGAELEKFIDTYGAEQAGHSLYLTSAGHGAGFFDFEDGRNLYKLCEPWPHSNYGGFYVEFYRGWMYLRPYFGNPFFKTPV